MAVGRSPHQRAAYIATCRKRLNADEKQQHCDEEKLLRHVPLLSFANDVDSSEESAFLLNKQKGFSIDRSIAHLGSQK
jgi:hypothetical protein